MICLEEEEALGEQKKEAEIYSHPGARQSEGGRSKSVDRYGQSDFSRVCIEVLTNYSTHLQLLVLTDFSYSSLSLAQVHQQTDMFINISRLT